MHKRSPRLERCRFGLAAAADLAKVYIPLCGYLAMFNKNIYGVVFLIDNFVKKRYNQRVTNNVTIIFSRKDVFT